MAQQVVTPSNLGAEFDLGILVPNKISVRLGTQAVTGIMRFASPGEFAAGTPGLAIQPSNIIGVFAPLASPTFTGAPAGPTPTAGDNSTKLATTAFVQEEIAGISPSSGTPFDEPLAVTALNTVAPLTNAPKAGARIWFSVNGEVVPNGAGLSATAPAKAVTVDPSPAGLGYDLQVGLDVLHVFYSY
jgi:hypothetical protein